MKNKNTRYHIYEISVIRLLKDHSSFDDNGKLYFKLNEAETASVILKMSTTDDNILMRQIRLFKVNEKYNQNKEITYYDKINEIYCEPDEHIDDVLQDIIYLNFDDVKFIGSNQNGSSKDYIYTCDKNKNSKRFTYKEGVKELLNNGVTLTLSGKEILFVPFEKSSSMSKQKKMSFINEKIKSEISQRINLNISPEKVDLAKYFAYKGLSLSGGTAINSLNHEKINNKTVCIVKDHLRNYFVSPDGKIIIEQKKQGYLFKSLCADSIKIIKENENFLLKMDDDKIQLVPCNNSTLELENDLLYLVEKGEKIKIKDLRYDISENKIYLYSTKFDYVSPDGKDYMFKSANLNMFDGEGIICPDYAGFIRQDLDNEYPTCFQIRMPFIKGMLYQVDFHEFYKEVLQDKYDNYKIKDIFGNDHKIEDLQMILTESQFKCSKWLEKNKECIQKFWELFKQNEHCLFVVNVGRKQVPYNHLNYQVVGTAALTKSTFESIIKPTEDIYNALKLYMPKGNSDNKDEIKKNAIDNAIDILVHGYEKHIITRNKDDNSDAVIDESDYQPDDYEFGDDSDVDTTQDIITSKKLKILNDHNELFNMDIYQNMLSKKAEGLLKSYGLGRYLIEGQNRFLSADLLFFLYSLIEKKYRSNSGRLKEGCFYAPNFNADKDKLYTIFRNPHATRNELIKFKHGEFSESSRRVRYLGHLENVVFIDVTSLQHEVLGGADFDGDRVVFVCNEEYNDVVKKYPIILIDHLPGKEDIDLKNSEDLAEDIYNNLADTFQNNIGIVCNHVFRQTVEYYNENNSNGNTVSQGNLDLIRESTALIGQEIDSAKTGIHPVIKNNDSTNKNDIFLDFKNIIKGKTNIVKKDFEKKVNALYDGKKIDEVYDNMANLHTVPIRTLKLLKADDKESIKTNKLTLKDMIENLSLYVPEKAEKIVEFKNIIDAYKTTLNKYQSMTHSNVIDYKLIDKYEDLVLSTFDYIDYEFLYNILALFKSQFLKDHESESKYRKFENFVKSKEWHWSNESHRKDLLKEKLKELLEIDNFDAIISTEKWSHYLDMLCNFDGKGNDFLAKICEKCGKAYIPSDIASQIENVFCNGSSNEENQTFNSEYEKKYSKIKDEFIKYSISLTEFKKVLNKEFLKDCERQNIDAYSYYKYLCVNDCDANENMFFELFINQFENELNSKKEDN